MKCIDCGKAPRLKRRARCRECYNRHHKTIPSRQPERRREYRAKYAGWDSADERDRQHERKRSERHEYERIMNFVRQWARILRRRSTVRKKPWLDPSLSAAESAALRYKLDTEYSERHRQSQQTPKVKQYQREKAARHRTERGVAYHLSTRLRAYFRGEGQGGDGLKLLLGYSPAILKRHVIKQLRVGEFAPGVWGRMTWQHYLNGDVVIDHKIPVSEFDLPKQLRECWSLFNLQPLTYYENAVKGVKRAA